MNAPVSSDLHPSIPLVTSSHGSIDAVLAELDRIIADSIRDASPLGYFAALYRMVTARIKQGIGAHEFEDDARMERFDVVFANRYLKALEIWRSGRAPSAVWKVAFVATGKWEPIVLQHLLLGMNAHIDLDLGIAAATVGYGNIGALKNDFDRINEILASLVQRVEDELVRIWPPLSVLLETKLDERVVSGGIELARDGAWRLAQELASRPVNEWDDTIRLRDLEATMLTLPLANPGLVGRALLLPVRLSESTVGRNIRILQGMETKVTRGVELRPLLTSTRLGVAGANDEIAAE